MRNSKPGAGSGRKLSAVTAVLAAVTVVSAAPAFAHRPPSHPPPRPDVVSSVNQYVELIPTSRGATPVAIRRSRGARAVSPLLRARLRTLPAAVAAALQRTVALGRPAQLRPVRGHAPRILPRS